MACPAQDITDTELSILKQLWANAPLSTRELAQAMYRRATPAACATVQSLLGRLEEKKYVRRERGQHCHVFHPLLDRNGVLERRLHALAEDLTDGALSPLISTLVRAERLTPKERRELLDWLQGPSRGSKDSK